MPGNGLRTAGLDLASQDKQSALAQISWSDGAAVLEGVWLGVGNDAIVAVAQDVRLLGIDCPVGWPRAFTDLLIAARSSTVAADAGADDTARRALAYRRTDHVVRERTGRWPLSVSADRIGYPAMRCAGLLARLADAGLPVVRSGLDSAIAEVYPAAALRIWGCRTAGYKADPGARAALVEELSSRAGWLDWGSHRPACVVSADVFDAVVCALVAGAVVLGRSRPPVLPEDRALADEEGWIHLPDREFLQDPVR